MSHPSARRRPREQCWRAVALVALVVYWILAWFLPAPIAAVIALIVILVIIFR
jgi:Flp pilus assembly protein TadB